MASIEQIQTLIIENNTFLEKNILVASSSKKLSGRRYYVTYTPSQAMKDRGNRKRKTFNSLKERSDFIKTEKKKPGFISVDGLWQSSMKDPYHY